MNKLTKGNNIKSLSFVRKHEFIPKIKEAMGEAEHTLLLSLGLMLSFLRSMLCGPVSKFDAGFIEEDKVHQVKLDIKSRSIITYVDFACSTNDIATSTFSQATR